MYYCVVDTRGWLRDPAPLFRTNVEGPRKVLDIAKDAGLQRFVFTSSYVTVGRKSGRIATEDDVIVDGALTPYVRSRVQAEDLVLHYARSTACPPSRCACPPRTARRLGHDPARRDHRGHGVRQAAVRDGQDRARSRRRDDAARAMILAAERGRVGERYLISEKMISNAEVVRIAAEAAGVPPPDQWFRCRCPTRWRRSAA